MSLTVSGPPRICARALQVKDTSNLIESPMPGTLLSLSVAAGEEVEAGQEVAVIEAMKMQNVLRAPRAGTVLAVHATVGKSLKVDELIATLAPKEGGAAAELTK